MLAILIVSISLGAFNNQIITFNYLLAQGEYRVSTLLVIFFTIGFLLGCIICALFYLQVYISLYKARRKIKQLKL